jgi:hypothetical protein
LFGKILPRVAALAAGLTIAAGLATPAMAASAAHPAPAALWTTTTPTCVIHASPASFVETGLGAEASSVAFVIVVECKPVYSEQKVEINGSAGAARRPKSALGRAFEPRSGAHLPLQVRPHRPHAMMIFTIHSAAFVFPAGRRTAWTRQRLTCFRCV